MINSLKWVGWRFGTGRFDREGDVGWGVRPRDAVGHVFFARIFLAFCRVGIFVASVFRGGKVIVYRCSDSIMFAHLFFAFWRTTARSEKNTCTRGRHALQYFEGEARVRRLMVASPICLAAKLLVYYMHFV